MLVGQRNDVPVGPQSGVVMKADLAHTDLSKPKGRRMGQRDNPHIPAAERLFHGRHEPMVDGAGQMYEPRV